MVDGTSHETRAENDGFVFLTTMVISRDGDAVTSMSAHDSQPQGFVAALQAIPMRSLFAGAIRKAILRDLEDIKAAVARRNAASA